jgi:hypothetical protein
MINPFDLVELKQELPHDFPNALELAFRKLSKRDVGTRLKGLDDLQNFFHGGDAQLSPELYSLFGEKYAAAFNKGMVDPEKRVRVGFSSSLKTIYETDRKLLPKSILFAWFGGLFDPFEEVSCVLEPIFPADKLSNLKTKLLEESKEWIEFRAGHLLEGYQKDADLMEDSQSKSELLCLGEISRDLAISRSIRIYANLYDENTTDFISGKYKYSRESTIIRLSLLYYYISVNKYKVPDILKETQPKLLCLVSRCLVKFNKSHQNESYQISPDFIFNFLSFGDFSEQGAKNSLIELLQISSSDPYKDLLLPALLKFRSNFLDPNRSDQLFHSIIILLCRLYPEEDGRFHHHLNDFFKHTIIEGIKPFGPLNKINLGLFPFEIIHDYVFSELSELSPQVLENPSQVRILNYYYHRKPVIVNPLEVSFELAQKIPFFQPIYLDQLAHLDGKTFSLFSSSDNFDSLFEKIDKNTLHEDPENAAKFLSLVDDNQLLKFIENYPEFGLVFWEIALRDKNLKLAIRLFPRFPTPQNILNWFNQIPEEFFKNEEFCRLIVRFGDLSNLYHMIPDQIASNIVTEQFYDKDIKGENLWYLCANMGKRNCLATVSMDFLNELEIPSSFIHQLSLDSTRRSANPPKSLSTKCEKALILGSFFNFSNKNLFGLEIIKLWNEDLEGGSVQFEFQESLRIPSHPIVPSQSELNEIIENSKQYGNYWSLLLERYLTLSDIPSSEKDHPHHKIITLSFEAKNDPSKYLSKVRDSLDSSQIDSDSILGLVRSKISDVKSDIIIQLIEKNSFELLALWLLENSPQSEDFWKFYLEMIENLIVSYLADDRLIIVFNSFIKINHLQRSDKVSQAVYGLFVKFYEQKLSLNLHEEKLLSMCARIIYTAPPQSLDLIPTKDIVANFISGDICGSDPHSLLLLTARFLIILEHDRILSIDDLSKSCVPEEL